jgi:hypothetical protein
LKFAGFAWKPFLSTFVTPKPSRSLGMAVF